MVENIQKRIPVLQVPEIDPVDPYKSIALELSSVIQDL